jgi:hypothetical protein
MDIPGHDDDKNGLLGIPPPIWVLYNVEEPPAVDREDDILERYTTVPLELCILLLVPAECFHGTTLHQSMPFVIRLMKGVFGYARVVDLSFGTRSRRVTEWGSSGPQARGDSA